MYVRHREITLVFIAVAALLALYFPLALWVKVSWPGSADVTAKIRLHGPFARFNLSGFAYVARVHQLNQLGDLPDSDRSPVMLYEDNRVLGPAHSLHDDVANSGGGRFSHWKDIGIVFSTSDNTDPNSNGRTYWAVVGHPAARLSSRPDVGLSHRPPSTVSPFPAEPEAVQ
jgi:hypothetical protein